MPYAYGNGCAEKNIYIISFRFRIYVSEIHIVIPHIDNKFELNHRIKYDAFVY